MLEETSQAMRARTGLFWAYIRQSAKKQGKKKVLVNRNTWVYVAARCAHPQANRTAATHVTVHVKEPRVVEISEALHS